jgi:hypothetical protein
LIYYLHTAAPLAPATRGELPQEVNGQPVAYFWADGIRAGRYLHPAGQFELHVDGARLDNWAENFRRMRAAGIDVPVPVDHSSSARDNLGYVIDVQREGDRLRLLHQLIGDDAIRLAARNKVSLAIDPQFVDGHGNAFGDCVVHSSLTPVPVVPGQGGFVPLSRDAGGAIVKQAMVFHPIADLSPLRDWHVNLLRQRVGALVSGGNLTPACGDRLMRLLSPRTHPGVMLLSREGDYEALDALLAAFADNRALPLGERTGLQTLARLVPGDEPAVDVAIQSRMVRMANGK